jgi:hypothetical protein
MTQSAKTNSVLLSEKSLCPMSKSNKKHATDSFHEDSSVILKYYDI